MDKWSLTSLIIGVINLLLLVSLYATKGTVGPYFILVLSVLLRPLVVASMIFLSVRIGLAALFDFLVRDLGVGSFLFHITRRELLTDILITLLLLFVLLFWYQYGGFSKIK